MLASQQLNGTGAGELNIAVLRMAGEGAGVPLTYPPTPTPYYITPTNTHPPTPAHQLSPTLMAPGMKCWTRYCTGTGGPLRGGPIHRLP